MRGIGCKSADILKTLQPFFFTFWEGELTSFLFLSNNEYFFPDLVLLPIVILITCLGNHSQNTTHPFSYRLQCKNSLVRVALQMIFFSWYKGSLFLLFYLYVFTPYGQITAEFYGMYLQQSLHFIDKFRYCPVRYERLLRTTWGHSST